MGRNAAGEIGKSEDLHAIAVENLSEHGSFDVAAALDCQIHDDASALHGADHFRGHNNRRFASEDLSGGDDDVGLAANFFHAFALFAELLVGQRFGVALFGLAGFANVNAHKTGA